MKPFEQLHTSYRDPSGFMFKREGVYYRQINTSFKEDFKHFIASGCYEELVKREFLIAHEAIEENYTGSPDWYLTLKPVQLNYVSHPYEWSFDMLRDAAQLTLNILKIAVGKGMILKDATPYNIQFHQGKMLFIDSLSFEKYDESQPWIAYRQFCEQFLSPLLISYYNKFSASQLLQTWPDGIPLEITRSLLPNRSKWSLHIYLHIHLHAKISSNTKNKQPKSGVFTQKKLIRLIESLETVLNKISSTKTESNWNNYYEETALRGTYLEEKKEIINNWLDKYKNINKAADLGSNNGVFSTLLSNRNIFTVAADSDPVCINQLYQQIVKKEIRNIHPSVIDLCNPSPSTGFNNEERPSFISRGKFDLVMGLALIHHLAIAKNIPFYKIAELFSTLSLKYIIIEYVPKEDEKAKQLLSNRKDIFKDYTVISFEHSFEPYFTIEAKELIGDSGRALYLMEKK